MAVVPQQILDYISRQEEEDLLKQNQMFLEGQGMLSDLNQNITDIDLPEFSSQVAMFAKAFAPTEAISEFKEGDIVGGSLELADYAKEMTGVAALADLLGYGYNVPENKIEDRNSIYANILAGNVGTAALQALGVTPFGRISKAIDKARMADDVAVPTRPKDIVAEKDRYLETAADRNIPEPRKNSLSQDAGLYPSITLSNYQDTYKALVSDNPNEIALPYDGKRLSGMLRDNMGADLVNSIADRTGNRTVYQVGDDVLSYPYNPRGGFTFLREEPNKGWAISNPDKSFSADIASRPDNQKILMPSLMTAAGGSNFNSAVTGQAIDIISTRGRMNRKNLAELNEAVLARYGKDDKDKFVPFKLKDFKEENLQETIQRVAVDGTSLDKRAFMEALDSKKLKQNDAFPDVGLIRIANHNPDYDFIPQGSLGLGAILLDKDNLYNVNPIDPHTTYATDILGKPLLQQSEIFYPQQLVMSDFYDSVMQKRGYDKYKDMGQKYKAIELGFTDFKDTLDSKGVKYTRSRAMTNVDERLADRVEQYEEDFINLRNSDRVQQALEEDDLETYMENLYNFYINY